MSDKEFVLSAIRRMPKSVSLAQIRERVDFLAAVKKLKGRSGVIKTKVSPVARVKSTTNRAFHQAAGMWKGRKDLPDLAKLRQEWKH